MNKALEITEVTDRDYRPSRDEVLSYPTRTFSEDIGEYILKLKDNDDLKHALQAAWYWDRDLIRYRSGRRNAPAWDMVVTEGDCMKELIYKLGKIVYANFLAQTEAK